MYQKARYRDLDTPPTLAALRAQFGEFSRLVGQTLPFVDSVGEELAQWSKKLDTADNDAARRARESSAQFKTTLAETQVDLKKLRMEANAAAGKLVDNKRKEEWEALVDYTRRLLTLADQLIAVQTQIRINRIELPEIKWKEPDALAFAKSNRLDLQTEQRA